MLNPTYLAKCGDDVAKLFAQLEADISADIAARVAKMGRYSDTSQWQAMKLREASAAYDMCNQMLRKCKRKSSGGIKEMFVLGSKEALAFDDAIYRAAGLHPSSIASSRALMDIIIAGVQKTNGLMDNLTMTTARDASHSVQNALDRAYMQVISGAYSYDEAARRCINELGQKGYREFVYDSGTHTSLEAATRRAMLTGLNQTTAQLQIARAQDMECDLVEVTSHAGARPEHFVWQGKIYCLNGKRGKYKDFYKETGYGTGPGLCGWNCYHNFYPYIEGVSTPSFEHDPAKRLGISNDELYERTQRQRGLERQVRESRRQCQTLDAAIQQASEELAEKLQQDFSEASVRLKRREAKLRKFCEETGLPYDGTRVGTYGFSRSTSARAVWANRKAEREAYEHERLKKIYPNTVAIKVLDAPGYVEKFTGITGKESVDHSIYESAVRMLSHRNKTNGEDLCLIDGDTGEILYSLVTSTGTNSVSYDNGITEAITKAKGSGQRIVAIHNHPNGLPPSLDDGVSARVHGYDIGVVVGHNLEVFTYSPTNEVYSETECAQVHEAISTANAFSIDLDEKLWYNILKRFGMEVKRK